VLEALSDLFESGEAGLDPVVLVGLGELGWSFTDEQHERAVGHQLGDVAAATAGVDGAEKSATGAPPDEEQLWASLRNVYDPLQMREAGFAYSCIGRPVSAVSAPSGGGE